MVKTNRKNIPFENEKFLFFKNIQNADIFKDCIIFTRINEEKDNTTCYDVLLHNILTESNQTLISDSVNKHVKLKDSSLFSTSGALGLKVFDLHKNTEITNYRIEKLYDHTWNYDTESHYKDCIITHDDINIKIYDLRMRYMVENINTKNMLKKEAYEGCFNRINYIDWYKNGYVVKCEDVIFSIEDKKFKRYYTSNEDKNLVGFDFAISNGYLFINANNEINYYENDKMIVKTSKYKNIAGVKNGTVSNENNLTGISGIINISDNISNKKAKISKTMGYLQIETTKKVIIKENIGGYRLHNFLLHNSTAYFQLDRNFYKIDL